MATATLPARLATDRTLAATVLVHATATLVMVGLIWTVQLVHYPLFENVGAEAFPDYQSRHVDQIGYALALPWSVEGLSIVALLVLAKERTMRTLAFAGAALMGLILILTALWAAPVHGELLDGFDAEQHDTLMTSNLIRSLLWTARGGVAIAMVWLLLDRRDQSTSPPTEAMTP